MKNYSIEIRENGVSSKIFGSYSCSSSLENRDESNADQCPSRFSNPASEVEVLDQGSHPRRKYIKKCAQEYHYTVDNASQQLVRGCTAGANTAAILQYAREWIQHAEWLGSTRRRRS